MQLAICGAVVGSDVQALYWNVVDEKVIQQTTEVTGMSTIRIGPWHMFTFRLVVVRQPDSVGTALSFTAVPFKATPTIVEEAFIFYL